MDVKDQAAIVTGGGSGLGETTARALAAAGARVAIFDLVEDAAKRVAQDIGGIACVCDVSNGESTEAALAKARDAHGAARIVVQCAGIAPPAKIVGRKGPHALELYVKVIGVNLIGIFNVMRLAAADMLSLEPLATGDRGVIINTASIAGFEGQVGIFKTPMMAGLPEETQKSLGASVPFPSRLGDPKEYAKLVLHICDNLYLNGEVIRVDGALRMQG
jgi:NAD(P)-dependent dehydrogenase (short-subunit alcohol dehydrogenase family)